MSSVEATTTSLVEWDTSALESRSFVETGGMTCYRSRRNNLIQFRLMGGLRIVQTFIDAFAGHELGMSKAFFTDFIQKDPAVFQGGARLRDLTALFKAGIVADADIVGLQFEVCREHGPLFDIKSCCGSREEAIRRSTGMIRWSTWPIPIS